MYIALLDVMDDSMTTATEDFDWGDEFSTFGDRLARAREHAGMNQSELARRLGVKLATLRNWESDRSEPRSNRLQMLSGLLGVSIVWLMSGHGDGAPAMDLGSSESFDEVLAELRELRLAQKRLSERTGRLEKRLKAFASAG